MKARGERITVLTAYDFLFARLVDRAGTDVVLVGDSLAQVVLGLDSTLPVTLDEMIHHARAVRRGVERALLVVDLPFLTYQVSREDALRNAGRIMKETGASAVKLEGGSAGDRRHGSRALVRAGIPVMGHLGFTPQSVNALGGFRVQGAGGGGAGAARGGGAAPGGGGRLLASCWSWCPGELAAEVTAALTHPHHRHRRGRGVRRAGARAPRHARAQREFQPRFLRRFAELGDAAEEGIAAYVRGGAGAASTRPRSTPSS